MWTREQRLALACAAGVSTPIEGIDWQAVDDSADENGIIAWVEQRALREGWPVPPARLARWKKIAHDTLALNLAYLATLKDIAALSAAPGLGVLKGGALLETVYPDLSLRPLSDLDLFVEKARFPAFVKTARTLGFSPHPRFPMRFEKGPLVLDVHFNPWDSGRIPSRRFVFGRDFPHCRFLPAHGLPGLAVPAPEDQLLQIAYHWVKHSFFRWIWLVDAALILEQNREGDFNRRIERRARDLGIAPLLRYLAAALRGLPGFSEKNWSLPAANLSRLEGMVVNRMLQGERMEQGGPILLVIMAGTPLRRLRLALETAIPRPEALLETTKDPEVPPWRLYFERCLSVARFVLKLLLSGFRGKAERNEKSND